MATSAANIVLSRIQEAVQASAAEAMATQENAKKNEADSMDLLAVQNRAVAADGILALQMQKAQALVEQAKARVAAAAGGETQLLDNIKQTVASGESLKQTAAEVRRARGRSIFDIVSDPIGTIKDVVMLPGMEDKLSGAVTEHQAIVEATSNRYKVVQQGFQEAEALKTTVNAATIQATSEKVAALQEENLIKARIAGRAYNLQGVQAATRASLQEVQLWSQARAATQAEEQLQLQYANLELSKDNAADRKFSRELALEEHALRLGVRKDQISEEEFLATSLKRGMEIAGVAVPDATRLKSFVKLAGNPNSPYAYYLANGMRNMGLGQNSNMLAASPGEAIEVIEKHDLVIPKQLEQAIGILRDANELVAKKVNRKAEPEKWNIEIGKATKELIAAEYANVRPGGIADVGPALETYILSSPDLMNLPVTSKLIAPILQAKQSISDPKVLINTGIAMVQKGEMSSSELITGLSSIYAKSSLIHVQALRLNDVGIIPPKVGLTYNVKLDSVFGPGSDTINLADSAVLGQYVARKIATNRVGFGRSTSPFGFN